MHHSHSVPIVSGRPAPTVAVINASVVVVVSTVVPEVEEIAEDLVAVSHEERHCQRDIVDRNGVDSCCERRLHVALVPRVVGVHRVPEITKSLCDRRCDGSRVDVRNVEASGFGGPEDVALEDGVIHPWLRWL